MTRPIQRAGHIADDDNRFCGAAVFGELADRVATPIDLLALAFGAPPLDAEDREVLRCLALCLTSPDARVWPLKMTRILAAHGNPYAGFFGAQLGNVSDKMGPGTTSFAAESLEWIAARAAEHGIAAAVAAHAAERGRLAGFGVPFRKHDERLLGLHRLLAGHRATRGAMWQLHVQIIELVRAELGLEPNLVFPMTALLLDLGLPARRIGLFVSIVMAHTFAAHALEAADQDGPELRRLPDEVIEYRGRSRRSLELTNPRR